MQHAVIGWLASACSALDLTALRVFVSFVIRVFVSLVKPKL